MKSQLSCSLCGRPVSTKEEERQLWKQMVGWVSPRGAKSMTLTRPTGAVAHSACIASERAGVPVEQNALF